MSDEIIPLQQSLMAKIDYFNKKAEELGLLVIRKERSPVFFIGVGNPNVGYSTVLRMKKAGFFFNLSVFPAVSIKHTGLRITLSNHIQIEDIDELLETLAENLPVVFKENNTSFEQIRKEFANH